jgi:hypothetical protein
MRSVIVIPIATAAQSAAAAHDGVQDRSDEKPPADSLEHERAAVGDAMRVDQGGAKLVYRSTIRQKEYQAADELAVM